MISSSRVTSSGRSTPAQEATRSAQGPAALTTIGVEMFPASVDTPATASPDRSRPVAGVRVAKRPPRSVKRRTYAWVVARGSAYPEPGSYAKRCTSPTSMRGSISSSSSRVISRTSTPSRRPISMLRAKPSDTYSGIRNDQPQLTNPLSPPISSSKLEKMSTLRRTMRTSTSLE